MFWYMYVGCRVFEVVKSYLCVSVPVLDDNCGAFICLVYDDSIMDDKLFRACLYVVLCLGFIGICNVLSTFSLMSSTFTWCTVLIKGTLPEKREPNDGARACPRVHVGLTL